MPRGDGYSRGPSHHAFKNVQGLRFGRLVVISGTPSEGNKVLALCDCGNKKYVSKKQLLGGRVTSCNEGECNNRTIDIVGAAFGLLTVVSQIPKVSPPRWSCLCVCGRVVEVGGGALRSGNTRSCGCSSGELASLYRAGFPGPRKRSHVPKPRVGKDAEYLASTHLYKSYVISANKRHISFELTEDQFSCLIKRKCYYCGSAPSSLYRSKHKVSPIEYYYNGIDRSDSDLGYSTSNCVTACSKCNMGKHRLSSIEFINLMISVAANHPI